MEDLSISIWTVPEAHPANARGTPVRTSVILGGRANRAHIGFIGCKGDAPSLQFKDPITDKMLVELRGDGGRQTVFPGSVHESGEPIEWVIQGEPLIIEYNVLCNVVKHLAARRSLIKRYCAEVNDRAGLVDRA